MDYVYCYGFGFSVKILSTNNKKVGKNMVGYNVHLTVTSDVADIMKEVIEALLSADVTVDYLAIEDDDGEMCGEYFGSALIKMEVL